MPLEWPTFDANDAPLEQLIRLSRYYGSDPRFVLVGGGNTSAKFRTHAQELLYVKASGFPLANIDRDGFVILDRSRLDEIVRSDFGPDVALRETRYKNAILDSRTQPEKNQRPSVESLLHHLLPGTFVVHTHCTLVNALTCHVHGEVLAAKLFGPRVLWVPFVDPGYTLGRQIDAVLKAYSVKSDGGPPNGVLLANHGMIISGDTPEHIKKATDEIVGKIAAVLGENWQAENFGPPAAAPNANSLKAAIKSALSHGANFSAPAAPQKTVLCDDSQIVMAFLGARGDAAKIAALSGPVNPDQIVYCTSYPVWLSPLPDETPDEIFRRVGLSIAEHQATHHSPPRIVLVRGVGLFALGDSAQSAETARNLYIDAIKIMSGAKKLGGIRFLTDQQRAFIETWEAEAYRRQIAQMDANPAK